MSANNISLRLPNSLIELIDEVVILLKQDENFMVLTSINRSLVIRLLTLKGLGEFERQFGLMPPGVNPEPFDEALVIKGRKTKTNHVLYRINVYYPDWMLTRLNKVTYLTFESIDEKLFTKKQVSRLWVIRNCIDHGLQLFARETPDFDDHGYLNSPTYLKYLRMIEELSQTS